MAIHAVNTLTGFSKDQLINTVLAHFALETVGVVGVIASHDSFVEDRFATYAAAVGAVGTYGRAVGEEEEVGIRGNLVSTLGTTETVNMEEGLSTLRSE
jgi:hypothetical protein